jgi:hypothetical protein
MKSIFVLTIVSFLSLTGCKVIDQIMGKKQAPPQVEENVIGGDTTTAAAPTQVAEPAQQPAQAAEEEEEQILEPVVIKEFDAENMKTKTIGGLLEDNEHWNLYSNGKVEDSVTLPADATYIFIIRGYGDPAGGEKPNAELQINGEGLDSVQLDKQVSDKMIRASLKKGTYRVAVAFTNDGNVGKEDRNLYVDKLIIKRDAQ